MRQYIVAPHFMAFYISLFSEISCGIILAGEGRVSKQLLLPDMTLQQLLVFCVSIYRGYWAKCAGMGCLNCGGL